MRYLLIILLIACNSSPKKYNESERVPPGVTTPTEVVTPVEPSKEIRLQWTDKRPICAMFLGSYNSEHPNPNNWKVEGVTGFTSDESFKRLVLGHAERSVTALKEMNAQGIVLWDAEGEKYPHPITYIGDPRLTSLLAPEFDAVSDLFFRKFTDAGLKVGICIRPDSLAWRKESNDYWHYSVQDPAQNMIDKISYAKKRWGCTMFYVDSNVWPDPIFGQLMNVEIFRKVMIAHPDCLIMPEHEDASYYKYSAPYQQLVSFRHLLNSDEKGFMVLYVPDAFPGWSDESVVTRLKESIEQGNIIMYRNWHEEPLNKLIKQAYESVSKRD